MIHLSVLSVCTRSSHTHAPYRSFDVDGFRSRAALAVGCMVLFLHALAPSGFAKDAPGTPPPAQKQSPDKVIAQIEDAYGVRIRYRFDRETSFPESWRNPPIQAEGVDIAIEELPRTLDVLARFLSAYPPALLREHLDTVNLFSRMTMYGKPYGGTNCRRGIYLVVRTIQEGYSDTFLLEVLHAEFSSILLRNHAFPEAAWLETLPAEFDYRGRGRDVLGEADLNKHTPELLADGFLALYATSSLENDVNRFVRWMFVHPKEFADLAKRHPRIRKKGEIVKAFYASLNPEGVTFPQP